MNNKIISKCYILSGTLLLQLNLLTNLYAGEYSSFNLIISHADTQRKYSNEVLQTQISSATVYRTEKLASKLNGNLILGYQEQTQKENSIIAARYASGYFIGVSLNYTVVKSTSYRLTMLGQYQYHQLEGADSEQKVTITWYDLTFGIKNYYNITERLKLLADVHYLQESGNQRVFDPISQTINFKNKSNISYGLGFAYYINASGYVAIKKLAGSYQGFQLYFAKDF